MSQMGSRYFWLLLTLGGVLGAQPKSIGFEIENLPVGKSVTIPRPATTLVPLHVRAILTATDMPQSLSVRLVGLSGQPMPAAGPVKVSIIDPNSEHAVSAKLRGDAPFIYNFRDLRPITVSVTRTGSEVSAKLLIESNKPLEISH